MAEQVPSIGRVVHFVMLNGKHRPAFVTEVWPNDMLNLQVMLDGPNDPSPHDEPNSEYSTASCVWRGSIYHDESGTLNTWHWPEYVPAKG